MLTIIGVVAAVAITVFAPPLGAALGAYLGISTAVATALVAVGLSVALSVGMSLAYKALGIGAPSAKNAVGPPQVFRQTISNSFIVYGKRRVGGLLVFFHSKVVAEDHFRYFVIACAGHRCQGVVSWMLGDEIVTVDGSGMVTSGKYASAAWLWFQRGLASETANSTFVSECDGKWTTAHKGSDVAAIYAKFKMTEDVVQAGMPNITAVIEGRDEVFNPAGAVGYTRNQARIFYDWMQIPREEGGFGAYADEIPDDTWVSAQVNVCDETVNGAMRYAIDAVITTGASPADIRDVLIVNAAGTYTYSGGKHLMRPGYWVPPNADPLSEDDLAGPIQVSPFVTSDAAANEVQGTYISPDDNYQGAPLTTQILAVPPTDIRQMDVDLAFTTNKDQGDRVLRIMLNRAQAEKTVMWPMNIKGVGTRALDTVQLGTDRYSLSNYAFSVAGWGLSPDWGVVLSLREENEDIYVPPTLVAPVVPPTVVVPSPLLTRTQIMAALRSTYPRSLVVSTAESGGSASVTFSDFNLEYPGRAPVAVTGTTLTGRTPATTYFPFIDVDSIGDSTPTFGTTTTYADAINSAAHPYRVYLLQSVTTPASGSGGSGTATPTGGGFGGGTNIP